MAKVLHIRDVPDDVHDALTRAADEQGVSLTRYMQRELAHLAGRPQVARENVAGIRRTQAAVVDRVAREEILDLLDEGRGD